MSTLFNRHIKLYTILLFILFSTTTLWLILIMLKYFVKLGFYPSLMYNVFMEKCAARQWFTKIDDVVILGALPFKSMTEDLVKNHGVKAVLSLNEDFELKLSNNKEEWNEHGVTLLKLPTLDFIAAPTQKNLEVGVNFLVECREKKEVVYVHCKAGRTRSATVVACYLMQVHGCSSAEAIKLITEKRPHVWLREKQLQAIECYYKENIKEIVT